MYPDSTDVNMNKILFFGDSNTYGYDPRSYIGERLGKQDRWAGLVDTALTGRKEVLEAGQNGRPLPRIPGDEEFVRRFTRVLGEGDTFAVMLGTNDILLTNRPDAGKAVSRMRSLLGFLEAESGMNHFDVIIIAPPLPSGEYEELKPYRRECAIMNQGFKKLCEEKGIRCIDSGAWNVPMSYDGVHISVEGHRLFAEKMLKELGI